MNKTNFADAACNDSNDKGTGITNYVVISNTTPCNNRKIRTCNMAFYMVVNSFNVHIKEKNKLKKMMRRLKGHWNIVFLWAGYEKEKMK